MAGTSTAPGTAQSAQSARNGRNGRNGRGGRDGRGAAGVGTRSGPWAYSAPAILSLLAWVYVPMVATGVASLLDWNLTTPARFVGLANYRRLLADHDFYRALWQTGWYVIMMLPLATAVPLALAIALWLRPGRASSVYRALLFLPVVLAPAANAVSWQFILNPLQGVTNTVLVGLGLPGPGWLNDPSWAPLVIVAITTGKIVGLNTLLFSASLSAIDLSTIEVARIDGATSWEIVRYVVVPQLVRPVALLGLLCVLLAGQWIFTNVALVTQGGPDGSTDNAFYRIYTYAFTFFDTGTAAAAAVVITVGVAVGYVAVRQVTGRIRRDGAPVAG